MPHPIHSHTLHTHTPPTTLPHMPHPIHSNTPPPTTLPHTPSHYTPTHPLPLHTLQPQTQAPWFEANAHTHTCIPVWRGLHVCASRSRAVCMLPLCWLQHCVQDRTRHITWEQSFCPDKHTQHTGSTTKLRHWEWTNPSLQSSSSHRSVC